MDSITTANIALFAYLTVLFIGIAYARALLVVLWMLNGRFDWMDAPSGVPLAGTPVP